MQVNIFNEINDFSNIERISVHGKDIYLISANGGFLYCECESEYDAKIYSNKLSAEHDIPVYYGDKK